MNYIFENKKYLFLDDISKMCSLAYYSCFLFILFNQFNMFVYFYYRLIKLEKNLIKNLANMIR